MVTLSESESRQGAGVRPEPLIGQARRDGAPNLDGGQAGTEFVSTGTVVDQHVPDRPGEHGPEALLARS